MDQCRYPCHFHLERACRPLSHQEHSKWQWFDCNVLVNLVPGFDTHWHHKVMEGCLSLLSQINSWSASLAIDSNHNILMFSWRACWGIHPEAEVDSSHLLEWWQHQCCDLPVTSWWSPLDVFWTCHNIVGSLVWEDLLDNTSKACQSVVSSHSYLSSLFYGQALKFGVEWSV